MKNIESLFRPALETALRGGLAHLAGLDAAPVAATVDLATLRARLGKELGTGGLPAEQVVEELIRDVSGGLLGSAGGRFFAWVIGGSLPAALAADWLSSAWDQNAGLHACGPAAAVTEEVAGRWLKELFGLPATASFGLVTGCQMAHATCLAAARHALLARRGHDVEELGLSGAPPIRILTSRNRHGSFERAVRLVGIGRGRIELLESDQHDGLVPAALAAALAADQTAPTIVLLQAGDVNIGSCDDFASLIPLARDHGAWIHVDGAFGLWAATSPRLRHLVSGVELADSWATDGHKWLNVPYDCGYAFVADPDAHRGAMSHRAPYLTHDAAGARDQMDWNPEFSRRARGFATYAALRQLGKDGVAALVEASCEHAAELVRRIGELPGAEVVWTPTLNQGLLRFPDPRPDAGEEDHARHTEATIAAILATGEAFFGPSTWRGKRVMRVSVSGWQTTGDDVDRVVAAVAGVLGVG